MNVPDAPAVDDLDRDSLKILPLSIVPIATSGIRRARMIKNARYESVVELFRDAKAGSGQMPVAALPTAFPQIVKDDMTILGKLAKLTSYDIYSLRIALRDLDIPVNDVSDLKLSDAKRRQLEAYMGAFTRPLILKVYGDDGEITALSDIVALFRSHDVSRARERLGVLAKRLGIKLGEIPRFLQDYGDTYLSVAYFRRCAEELRPKSSQLVAGLTELSTHKQLGQDRDFVQTCKRLVFLIDRITDAVENRFRLFEAGTTSMWEEVNAANFYAVRQMIHSNHTRIGGMLCGLSACLDGWAERFPTRDAGGPHRRADYVRNELRFAVDNLRVLAAPDAA